MSDVKEYIVVGEDGCASIDDCDEAESFTSLTNAQVRAEELAAECPGQDFHVFEKKNTVRCRVQSPEWEKP
jgi:hypothetical protein